MKTANGRPAVFAAAALGLGILTVSIAAPTSAQRHPFRAERQPDINRAIANLEQSSRDLHRANRDFGGHRARAAQLVDQAIAQLRQAKLYDDTHGRRR